MEFSISLSCKDENFMVKPSMLDALIHKLTPHYQNLKYRTVFLILFGVSLFVRLPFFFRVDPGDAFCVQVESIGWIWFIAESVDMS